ncbi:hypothetical protein NC652_023665 [Populus alba x Populus x berolinensis]|nr:hypothetical protein NC652_023665 [Populus alba x Populus x berolinensis]KAJ6905983.1 hypothetical protein NC652_023665 [Populus alba x Populus x berolinensis]
MLIKYRKGNKSYHLSPSFMCSTMMLFTTSTLLIIMAMKKHARQ